MANLDNFTNFDQISQSAFEEAVQKAAKAPGTSRLDNAAARIAKLFSGKGETVKIGIRSVSLEKLSKQLESPTLSQSAILETLRAVKKQSKSYENAAALLQALQSAMPSKRVLSIKTIDETKELFAALATRRFEHEAHEVDAMAQFGDTWKFSPFNKWLQKNPESKALVDSFYTNLPAPDHFLKEILGSYIKNDRHNQPVIQPANTLVLETYLDNHPELVSLLLQYKDALIETNKAYAAQNVLQRTPTEKISKLENLENMLTAKHDLLYKLYLEPPTENLFAQIEHVQTSVNRLEKQIQELENKPPLLQQLRTFLDDLTPQTGSPQEKVAKLTAYIQTLLNDSSCTAYERQVLNEVLTSMQTDA